MLAYMVNECRFELLMTMPGAFLIQEKRLPPKKQQEGEVQEKSGFPDAIPIRSGELAGSEEDFNPLGKSFYVPGASLRGLWRSQAERLVRTPLPDDPRQDLCCNPLQEAAGNEQACGAWLTKNNRKKEYGQDYACSCAICRLFGSSAHASRIHFSDGTLVPKPETSLGVRDHVAIDRFTGGSCHGAKFNEQVLENAAFRHTIRIRNFELWQLGLLAFVLRDLKDWREGFASFGYGKNKGFGLVQGEVEDSSFTITFYGAAGRKNPKGESDLGDLGDLLDPETRLRYDLKPAGGLRGLGPEHLKQGDYFRTWHLNREDTCRLWEQAALTWLDCRPSFTELQALRQRKPEALSNQGGKV